MESLQGVFVPDHDLPAFQSSWYQASLNAGLASLSFPVNHDLPHYSTNATSMLPNVGSLYYGFLEHGVIHYSNPLPKASH